MDNLKYKIIALIIVVFDFIFIFGWDPKYLKVIHRGHPPALLIIALALIFFSDFFESFASSRYSDMAPAVMYQFLGWTIIILLTPWIYYRFLISG